MNTPTTQKGLGFLQRFITCAQGEGNATTAAVSPGNKTSPQEIHALTCRGPGQSTARVLPRTSQGLWKERWVGCTHFSRKVSFSCSLHMFITCRSL